MRCRSTSRVELVLDHTGSTSTVASGGPLRATLALCALRRLLAGLGCLHCTAGGAARRAPRVATREGAHPSDDAHRSDDTTLPQANMRACWIVVAH
jgi:hypothetical protein